MKLGHITFSNVYPIHAAILNGTVACPFEVVRGIPSELNSLLLAARVDVAASSSIEYASHPDMYMLLPDLSITSRNRVMSILLESKVPLKELGGRTIALTSASATSVVLLRIILEIFERLNVDYVHYDQVREDPYGRADAVLTIGDLALKRAAAPSLPHSYDLGAVWHQRTALPFVFALWQVHYRKDLEADLGRLYDILMESKRLGLSRLQELADESSSFFGLSPQTLVAYWKCFSYDLGPYEQKGLLTYYAYAREIGVIDAVPDLRIWRP